MPYLLIIFGSFQRFEHDGNDVSIVGNFSIFNLKEFFLKTPVQNVYSIFFVRLTLRASNNFS